ncbi:MAG: PQQ-binding-like beta-propeller repeat protein [Blastocatellia bacterium]|nr:PQQ-binding-like beta-propeller repeat protein [Blastocatellia bacterium]
MSRAVQVTVVLLTLFIAFIFHCPEKVDAQGRGKQAAKPAKQTWGQWRGPMRDGKVGGPAWPERLSAEQLELMWKAPAGLSYSGPIVSENAVFVTETKDKSIEIVHAFDRATGRELWKVEWQGAISVPFFAKKNGDWIRSTPAYDGKSLFVAGMRDVLVSLDAKTGREQWRVDFVKELKSPVPEFGFICSPLVDGDVLYVQAGNAVVKLDKATGRVIWQALKNPEGIMTAGAFSSPVLAEVAGKRQLLVQTREKLAGIDPATGEVLWLQDVPNFRGMNILTPVVFGDTIFTSSYQNKSWLYKVTRTGERFSVQQVWENTAQGYMSTPVVIDGYAYLHLGNQRVTCVDLKTGERTWTSTQRFGKYWSMVAQGDRILALDEEGKLLMIRANPKAFEVIDERVVSDPEAWAHLALCDDQVFVRDLNTLHVYRWRAAKAAPAVSAQGKSR